MSHYRFTQALGLLFSLGVTAGCANTGIAYIGANDEAEFAECRRGALAMDASATSNRSSAQFVAAARQMQHCVEEERERDAEAASQQLLQLHAQSILAFIKGGDAPAARAALIDFQASYPARDLYFADNTSVVDTLSVLLGTTPTDAEAGDLLNVAPLVSSEIRRIDYWQSN